MINNIRFAAPFLVFFMARLVFKLLHEEELSSCYSTGYFLARHRTMLGCPAEVVLSIQGSQVEMVERRWQDTREEAVTVSSWECLGNGSVQFKWDGPNKVEGYFSEEGDKLILTTEDETGWDIQRISQERASQLKKKDPLCNIPNPYQKKVPGKLVILTGVPGSGKSSIARWLRDHAGFVYYEHGAFYCGANPYFKGVDSTKESIPLVGEGMKKRFNTILNGQLSFPGEKAYKEALLEFSREIIRERNRLGGDWIIAGIFRPDQIESLQTMLGEELQTIVLMLDSKMQEERLIARNDNDGLVSWYLFASKSFNTAWLKERTRKVVEDENSTAEDNARKVLDMIFVN